MPLNIGNITDDQTEELLLFARRVAGFKLYGTEMDCDSDDAIDCLNELIDDARNLTGFDPLHRKMADGPYECAECGADDHPSSECPDKENPEVA